MKVIKRIILISLFCFGLLNIVKADVLPVDSHIVKTCITIENPNAITGYKLALLNVEQSFGSKFANREFLLVENGNCLPTPLLCGGSTICISTLYLIRDGIDINKINPRDIKYTTIFKNNILNEIINIVKIVFLNYLEIPESRLGIDSVKFNKKFYGGYWISNTSKLTYENIIYRLYEENGIYKLEMVQKESNVTGKSVVENLGNDGEIITSTRDNYVYNFFQSRLLTIFIETVVLFLLCKLFLKKYNLKNGKIVLVGILASTITLPILWFTIPLFIHNWMVFAIFGEIFVTIVEVVIIKYLLDIKRSKAILLSVICNLFSCLIGLLI